MLERAVLERRLRAFVSRVEAREDEPVQQP
jgi:hypothetical protein